jgi:hypothetical protein
LKGAQEIALGIESVPALFANPGRETLTADHAGEFFEAGNGFGMGRLGADALEPRPP